MSEGGIDQKESRPNFTELAKKVEDFGKVRQTIASSDTGNRNENIAECIGIVGKGEKNDLLFYAHKFVEQRSMVDGLWASYLGIVKNENEKSEIIEGEDAKVIFEKTFGTTALGEIKIEKTDLTVHFRIDKEEDMNYVLKLDAQERKLSTCGAINPDTHIHGELLGGLMVRGHKLFTVEFRRDGFLATDTEVRDHERKHAENAIWFNDEEWGTNKRHVSKEMGMQEGNKYWSWLPKDTDLGTALSINFFDFTLRQKTGNTLLGGDDNFMADEFIARVAAGQANTEKGLMGMFEPTYFCRQLVVAGQVYLDVLKKRAPNFNDIPDNLDVKFTDTLKTVFDKNSENLQNSITAFFNLAKLYGDSNYAANILSYYPFSKWPSIERLLTKYGSRGKMDVE